MENIKIGQTKRKIHAEKAIFPKSFPRTENGTELKFMNRTDIYENSP